MKKKVYSHEQAEKRKRDILWHRISNISLSAVIDEWLSYMLPLTKKNYLSGIHKLENLGIFSLNQSVQDVSLVNHDEVLEKIANVREWSACSKQARAAAYISLTRFLARKTEGLIKRAQPKNLGSDRTFFQVREKVKTAALSERDWKRLMKALETVNKRDALIAKLCLQGARRIGEVLHVKIEQCNFQKKQILFHLNKTGGFEKIVIVTIPMKLSFELIDYIGARNSGYVFITSRGRTVHYSQILKNIKKAAIIARLDINMHTHVLRTSAITHLRSLRFPDFEIQRLTGHSSSQMLNAYDKTSLENNSSKRVSLI